ncbi:hypothetical protein BH10PSE19_BH10PSE19_15540 [soil metagenome]
MATIHIHALDVDSVLSPGHEYPYHNKGEAVDDEGYLQPLLEDEFIQNIQHIYNYIKHKTAEEKPDRIILKSFSARQSCELDFANAQRNESYVSTPLFRTLERYLKIKLNPVLVDLNTTLLADIHRPKASRRSFEEIQQLLQALRTNPTQTISADSPAFFDETKAILIYFIAHQLAAEYPKDELVLHVYDDRFDIVSTLQYFYIDNRDLLPTNITLQLHQCTARKTRETTGQREIIPGILSTIAKGNPSDAAAPGIRLRPICGIGAIDKDYALGTLEMAKLAYPNKHLIPGKDRLNIAEAYEQNSAYLEKFRSKRNRRFGFLRHFWKHPAQAILTGAGLGICCYFILISAGTLGLAAVLWSLIVGSAGVALNHLPAAIGDILAVSNTRKRLALAASIILTLGLVAMTIWQAPAYLILLATCVIGYFVIMPTLTAWFNYIWTDLGLDKFIANCRSAIRRVLNCEYKVDFQPTSPATYETGIELSSRSSVSTTSTTQSAPRLLTSPAVGIVTREDKDSRVSDTKVHGPRGLSPRTERGDRYSFWNASSLAESSSAEAPGAHPFAPPELAPTITPVLT